MPSLDESTHESTPTSRTPRRRRFWASVLGACGLLASPLAAAPSGGVATGPHVGWSVAIVLLAVALFQLWLFVGDRGHRLPLWLGLTAWTVAIAALLDAPRLADDDTVLRLTACFLHLPIAPAIHFIWGLLSRPLPAWLRRYQAAQVVLAAGVLLLPGAWIEATAPARWLFLLPFFVALGQVFWHVLRQEDAGELVPFAVGAGAVVVTSGAETILQAARLGSARPWPTVAWGVLIFTALLTLARRRRRAEDELLGLRQHLEHMVEDRTSELLVANQRLEDELAERQLAEEAMRMLEAAVEQSVDGIAVTDLQGGLQFINESWAGMHGYEVFELLGYDLEIFHTPEQLRDQVEPLMQRVQAEGAQQAEVEHRRRGGAVFPTWQTATLLQDQEGEAIGFVFIVRDLTERRRAEEEQQRLESKVREAEKLESLGRLAERVANDYNNMLTGVLVNAGLALQELEEDDDLAQRLRQIEASAERAAEISDELMAYAGQEHAGQLLSLSELLREHRLELEKAATGAKLELHLKKSLPAVRGNAEQVLLSVGNLLHNAAQALPEEGGLVMLRTSVVHAKPGYFDGAVLEPEGGPGRYVFFEVSDTGEGMDEDTRARMFEPYFSTRHRGRGMGLAAVLGIVRAHHGGIRVFSQTGRGTTVEILLPATEEAQVPAADEPGLAAWVAFGTVLVVDDEQLVRDVAAKVLQRQGFEVLTAANGREAIDIFADRRHDIRVVLLDFEMPEMDGEAFVREVRRFDAQVRVLLMSGYTERNATQGFSGQLAGFLHKPFRPNELLRKVREVLERR